VVEVVNATTVLGMQPFLKLRGLKCWYWAEYFKPVDGGGEFERLKASMGDYLKGQGPLKLF
jgi:hypothetical protein